MGHTAFQGKRMHLFVEKVAWNITQYPRTAVAAYNRCATDIQSIIETLLVGMTQVYHDTAVVHLLNHLRTESAYTIMSITPTGTVANIIVTIVAQGDIDYTSLSEISYIGYIPVKSKTVLNTQYDGFAVVAFIFVYFCRCTGNAQIFLVFVCYLFYLVKNKVGILSWTVYIEFHF